MNATRKNWRIMGMTYTDHEFLIVMGYSREECEGIFSAVIAEYTHNDLKEVETIWIEEWAYDECFDLFVWTPREELQLRRHRLKAAATHKHAMRRKSEVAA